MEDSQVPSKKEDHISGCDGEFSMTLMLFGTIDILYYDLYF